MDELKCRIMKKKTKKERVFPFNNRDLSNQLSSFFGLEAFDWSSVFVKNENHHVFLECQINPRICMSLRIPFNLYFKYLKKPFRSFPRELRYLSLTIPLLCVPTKFVRMAWSGWFPI